MSCNSSTHGAAVCEEASSAAAAAAVGTPVARRVAVTVWGVQNPLVSGERFSVNIAAKSLDGLPLDGLRIAVVDGNGRQVASTEPDLAQDHLACETAVDLEAPGQTGPQTWHAVPAIADARVGAGRPIPLSVTPRPTRPVRLQVTDAKSGKPLSDASAYFYHRNLAKVRPPVRRERRGRFRRRAHRRGSALQRAHRVPRPPRGNLQPRRRQRRHKGRGRGGARPSQSGRRVFHVRPLWADGLLITSVPVGPSPCGAVPAGRVGLLANRTSARF